MECKTNAIEIYLSEASFLKLNLNPGYSWYPGECVNV